MPNRDDKSLYAQVVRITSTYLGPAAERFIERQIQNHLNKKPDELATKDLDTLIDWISIAVSFLTEDSSLIEEYIRQLKQLTDLPRKEDR